jgi:DNA polymerase III subunit beta
MKHTVALKPEHLKAALLFAADNDVRYYLNGVYFNGKSGELVATDGHRVIAIDTSWRMDASVIIPRALIVNVLKVIPKKLDCVELSFDDESNEVTLYGLTAKAIEAKYPDYNAVMGNSKDKHVRSAGMFNVEYLMDASKAIALLGGFSNKFKMPPTLMVAQPRLWKGLSYEEACAAIESRSATHFGKNFRITIMPLRP